MVPTATTMKLAAWTRSAHFPTSPSFKWPIMKSRRTCSRTPTSSLPGHAGRSLLLRQQLREASRGNDRLSFSRCLLTSRSFSHFLLPCGPHAQCTQRFLFIEIARLLDDVWRQPLGKPHIMAHVMPRGCMLLMHLRDS